MTDIARVVASQQQKQRELTTTELHEQHNISPHIVYTWAPRLAELGLARKVMTTSRASRRGIWLVAPEGVDYLKTRVGARGRPNQRVAYQCASCGATLEYTTLPEAVCSECGDSPFVPQSAP